MVMHILVKFSWNTLGVPSNYVSLSELWLKFFLPVRNTSQEVRRFFLLWQALFAWEIICSLWLSPICFSHFYLLCYVDINIRALFQFISSLFLLLFLKHTITSVIFPLILIFSVLHPFLEVALSKSSSLSASIAMFSKA